MSEIGVARALVDQIRSDTTRPDVEDLLAEGRLRFGDSSCWAYVVGVLDQRLHHIDHLLARVTSLLRDLEVESLEQMFRDEGLA